jgi:hypothetical protein
MCREVPANGPTVAARRIASADAERPANQAIPFGGAIEGATAGLAALLGGVVDALYRAVELACFERRGAAHVVRHGAGQLPARSTLRRLVGEPHQRRRRVSRPSGGAGGDRASARIGPRGRRWLARDRGAVGGRQASLLRATQALALDKAMSALTARGTELECDFRLAAVGQALESAIRSPDDRARCSAGPPSWHDGRCGECRTERHR